MRTAPKTFALFLNEFNIAKNRYYSRAADSNVEAAGAWASNDSAAGKDLEQRSRVAYSSGVLVRATVYVQLKLIFRNYPKGHVCETF
jgi:hypothetical protein